MSYYSEKLMIPKSNITVLADKLIEGGYIERRDDPADRRKVVLALTPKGKEQVKESVCLFRESLAGSLAVLSQEDMEKLGKCIKEIHEIFKKIDEVQQ